MKIKVFLWHSMVAQTENHFCYSCGDSLRTATESVWNVAAKGNYWITQPVGQRNQNLEMSMWKKEVIKEVAFSKLNFNLLRTTVKTVKVASFQTYNPKFLDFC